jgi:hypothetical protein
MRLLTDDGRMAVENVAQRNGVSYDAAVTLLAALDRGNGFQAQFSHPEFGGMGQWSQGGMTMIGDMFNNGLKSRVDQICTELSNLMRSRDLFLPAPAFGTMGGGGNWWPPECGVPTSTGAQNDMQYALFPATHRLAIRVGGEVCVYDTGHHQISGFSQQQGGDAQNLTFTSQDGPVRLYDLGLIGGHSPAPNTPHSYIEPVQAPEHEDAPMPTLVTAATIPPQSIPSGREQYGLRNQHGVQQNPTGDEDIFAKIEKLHALMQKGILSEAEFAAKKKDLLDRL